jgi:hypothetical protein
MNGQRVGLHVHRKLEWWCLKSVYCATSAFRAMLYLLCHKGDIVGVSFGKFVLKSGANYSRPSGGMWRFT